MNKREELIELAGQVVNGIMSSDDSVWFKIIDRGIHVTVADLAVNIAVEIQKKIDEKENG